MYMGWRLDNPKCRSTKCLKGPCASVRSTSVGSGKKFRSSCAHTQALGGVRDFLTLRNMCCNLQP